MTDNGQTAKFRGWLNVEPEATRDLKPPPRTVLPPGQYNGSVARVSLCPPKIHPAQIRPKNRESVSGIPGPGSPDKKSA